MRKEPCAECCKLRGMLRGVEERERLLVEGIHNLLEEMFKLSGKKRTRNPMKRRDNDYTENRS